MKIPWFWEEIFLLNLVQETATTILFISAKLAFLNERLNMSYAMNCVWSSQLVCRIWWWQDCTEHCRVQWFIPGLFFPCRLQEARLEVLKKLLQRRVENQNELDAKRLDDHWHNHQKAKEEKIKKIQHDYALSKSERQGESSMRLSFWTSHFYFHKIAVFIQD